MGLLHDATSRFVPPSSRSFHALFSEVLDLRNDVRVLNDEVWKLREQNMDLQKLCSELGDLVSASTSLLKDDFDAHDMHAKMMLWNIMQEDGESLESTKRRFFGTLPEAEGDLRLLQQGNSHLLFEFDAFCREHNVQYWLMFGTLLGAVRHGGFIPWDDDLDVGMMRGDIQKLIHVTKASDKYRISSAFDWHAHCWQLRFMYRDIDNPCFIDLFIFDYSKRYGAEVFGDLLSLRQSMIDEMNSADKLAFWNRDNPILDANDKSSLSEDVWDVFRSYQAKAESINITSASCEDCSGITFSIENYCDSNDGILSYDIKDIFPVERLPFAGTAVSVPRDYLGILSGCYGDIWSLPKDIRSHYSHVPSGALAKEETKAAITRQMREH